ncbi:uncharacterized protein YlxW (UPF0749 family) [Actinoplanes campanulatus]|uniref:Uncharacterized protein YlxW (UPF0749 family) n=1 Tax=Actinoplanes campanulatus TaxID=113559 RepID=A0A7W5FDS9_9ACTN|nr:DUF881 domain-containing protein [Actinoplanes campanulatus]MBB3094763.1 uncharacterized protein YlxW (UPF0749 family) [Actinoplanes campanulatus]GGN07312.1 hypothetical protein GCM10010109_15510 [Actinoplanes campanulatus]GID36059.1 hypothetical protein Aca09nite_25650 [Actinoplanes campanulatus]
MIEPDETGSRAQTAAASAVPVAEGDPATTPAPADDNAPTVPGGRPTTAPTGPGDELTTAPGGRPTTAPTGPGDEFTATESTGPGDEFKATAPTGPGDEPTAEGAEPIGDEEPTVSLARRSAPDVPPHGFEGTEAAEAAPLGEGDAQAAGVPRSGDREDGEAEISATSPDRTEPGESDLGRLGRRWPAPAGALIWVLLALFGFTLVVQLRSNDADDGLAGMRQEDLVRILSDLEAQDSRLLTEIQELETSKQQLSSGVAGREAAQVEAEKRSQQLGLLAGTVAGSGPGLDITLSNVRASDVLNAVQELRGAGGEVMQLNGANGTSVRVVASSFFVDASGGGIIADGEQLTGPFRLLVIGPPSTMSTALQIPGGVVASVQNDGGSVTMDSRSLVEVTAVRKAAALRYARPVS